MGSTNFHLSLFHFLFGGTLVFLFSFHPATSENIVFFNGMTGKSHIATTWPLVQNLAEKGHNITFVTSISPPNPHPKVKAYVPKVLENFSKWFEEAEDFFEFRKNPSLIEEYKMVAWVASSVCEVMNDQEFVAWVKRTKVDLVFVDTFGNECGYALAHYWDAKVIFVDTCAPFTHMNGVYGFPDETSWIPGVETPYLSQMTFVERMKNALLPMYFHYFRKWTHYPPLEELSRKALGPMPGIEELEKSLTSMVFLNTHFSEDLPRSLPPNAVTLNGMAPEGYKPKPLPKDLADFLSKGTEGFIYISFGSHINFLKLSKERQEAFIGAINALPHLQFVWKVMDESLIQRFPAKNVYISKWLPQQDILAHPKIKAFVTQSGRISMAEAIHNAVPLIMFPVFTEQDYNAGRIHEKGAGIRMEILEVTQQLLVDAIKDITTNPEYAKNMKMVSNLFKDRPMPPTQTAVWWTEYVLRHTKQELKALRPHSVEQPWWLRSQLDVWAVIGLSLGMSIWLTCKIFSTILRRLCGSKGTSKTKLKTN